MIRDESVKEYQVINNSFLFGYIFYTTLYKNDTQLAFLDLNIVLRS